MKKFTDLSQLNDKELNALIRTILSKKIIFIYILITLLFIQIHILITVSLLFLYIGIIYSLKEYSKQRRFMQNFAREHNLTYKPNEKLTEFKGNFFKIGSIRKISHILEGKINKYNFKIFNYKYTLNKRRNHQIHLNTISEIKIPNIRFPHIFLKSDSMQIINHKNTNQMKNLTRISLNLEHEKSFNLYCNKNYEIEVLQIFTEDLLEFLHKNGNNFSVEFVNDRIYIYDDKTITKKEDLKTLLDITKHIIINSGDLISRLIDDFESLHIYNKK